jgi:hypothetical protein
MRTVRPSRVLTPSLSAPKADEGAARVAPTAGAQNSTNPALTPNLTPQGAASPSPHPTLIALARLLGREAARDWLLREQDD